MAVLKGMGTLEGPHGHVYEGAQIHCVNLQDALNAFVR
jgi:hypothetical protein